MRLDRVLAAAFLSACASGDLGGAGDDDDSVADAGEAMAADATPVPDAAPPLPPDADPGPPPPFEPVYRIQLRIHTGQSELDHAELAVILEEMNHIWWSQAAVCFEIHTVTDDVTMSGGFDQWYAPEVGGPNGYYAGDHDIWSRDHPDLGSAPNPVDHPTARTTAHELGHALDLPHRQDSDDNLMRSGTRGWQLNGQEITTARNRAGEKALEDTAPTHCAGPDFGP
jgi:hypothetical protein